MNRIILFVALVNLFGFSSCLMNKVQYVKDMSPDSVYNIKVTEAMKIQPNDRLAITVNSKDIELAAPFNTDLGGYKLKTEKEVIDGVNANERFEEGYLVDEDGNIEFPILGKIQVGGLSTEDIRKLLTELIKSKGYLDDPEVKVKLLNFKIITMGAIENKTFNITEGKITLLEAIVNAGGLTAGSDATKVMVIREENGKRRMLVANLEKYDMFNSEAYNLKQNDVVYVAHKYKQVSPGTRSVWQMAAMVIGVISVSLTAYALLIKN